MPPFIQICGYPRSGTSFCQSLVASHPQVYISGEVGRMVYPEIVSLLKRASIDYAEIGGQTARLWSRRKAGLVRDLFLAMSKTTETPREAAAKPVFGNKMPRVERLWAEIERSMRPAEVRFVYCLRDPVKAIQSKQNMLRSSRNFDHALRDYEKSIATLDVMLAKRPGRVHVFTTDAYQRDAEDTVRRMMAFIGVETSDEDLSRMLETPARNTTAQQMAMRVAREGDDARYVELDEAQRQRIDASPECRRARELLAAEAGGAP